MLTTVGMARLAASLYEAILAAAAVLAGVMDGVTGGATLVTAGSGAPFHGSKSGRSGEITNSSARHSVTAWANNNQNLRSMNWRMRVRVPHVACAEAAIIA